MLFLLSKIRLGKEGLIVSGVAHLLLGAFLLQRLELPVLLFVDEDPAALNVRHRLNRARRKEKSEVNICAK